MTGNLSKETNGDGVMDNNDVTVVVSCAISPSLCQAASYNSQIYYIHNDRLGTPKLLTDETGTPVWRAIATPFGQTSVDEDIDGDGINVVMNIRFPGQYYDAESGLHYNYFRYYDPSTGRYITSDPIGLRGGTNTYIYVRNNPLKYIDPFGLDTWDDDPNVGDISLDDPYGNPDFGDPYVGNDGNMYWDNDICITCANGDKWYIQTPGEEFPTGTETGDYFDEWRRQHQNTDYYCPSSQ